MVSSALVFSSQSKRASYGTVCFSNNMSVRKICVYLFVYKLRLLFPDSKHLREFVASYATKYSEIIFVIRKFFSYLALFSIPTAVRQTFSAYLVWIYIQSSIRNIILTSPVYVTSKQTPKISTRRSSGIPHTRTDLTS